MPDNTSVIILASHEIAFKMQLFKGYEVEYKKRHAALWPELTALLKVSGVINYSIFLDETTNNLFAVMKVKDSNTLNDLPNHPIMKKWWLYMKDIMETNDDNSPFSVSLEKVFSF